MKIWILSLALLASVSAYAGPGGKGGGKGGSGALGGNSGGGGSFVETPNSRTLVFWDLFINAPNFSESQPGDQLALRPRRTSPTKGNIGDWIDYRELKSFDFLRTRLRKWKLRAPNLVSIITKTGVGNLLDELRLSDPGNYPGYYRITYNHRFHFLLAATPLYIQDFDEIEVPPNIDLTGVRAYPTAYFRASNEVILVNMNYWNRAGLKSQAAMLLHEKMRNIQTRYQMSNAQLQKIVYDIIAREPDSVTEAEFNDRLFAPTNGNNSGAGTRMELAYYEFEFGFDCLDTPTPIPCMEKEHAFDYTQGLINKNSDPMTADEQIEASVKENILSSAPSEPRLRSTGKFTTPLVDRSPAPVPVVGEILNDQNCSEVYEKYKLDSRELNGAPCRPGWGFNTHNHSYYGMAFATPIRSEFNLQVTGALYSNWDGGSEFEIEAMGIKIHLHNQGPLYLFGDRNEFIGSKLTLSWDDAKKMHKYVFRFLFAQRRIDVVLNDDGNFRTNPALASWNMPDHVPSTLSKVSWKIHIYQNVRVPSIEILPAPSTPTQVTDPFENWKEKNNSGENYVSAPNEVCRQGYRSIFFDLVSARHECASVPAYFPKAGETCAQDFLNLKTREGRRICQNSRVYPEYWPMQGDMCAPGYTDAGFTISPGVDGKPWRSCVNPKRLNRYVLYNLGLHCDPAFNEKIDSWDGKRWIVCTRR